MPAEVVKFDQSYANNFWRLRKELFTELGEIAENEDLTALEDATKNYYLGHIKAVALLFGCIIQKLGIEIELFTCMDIFQNLCPDLLGLVFIDLPGVLLHTARSFDGPEAAVSCGITKVPALGIRSSEEYALTKMRRRTSPKGCTVDIILTGKEGTKRLHLGLPEPRQFTNLENPVAL